MHVLHPVAHDDKAGLFSLFQKLGKIGVLVIGHIGDDALVPARLALPVQRALLGKLHADIFLPRHGKDAPRGLFRALLHEYFIHRLFRL